MKNFFKITLVFCILFQMLSISTYAANNDFEINTKTGVLIKYNGPGGTVTIPKSVKTIGEWAFLSQHKVKKVIIPNSVKVIEEYAFRDCANLQSVNIPNSVTSIGESAFDGTALTSITIPSSVKHVGKRAFFNCPLKTANISSTITGFLAFEGCSELETLILTDSVKTISAGSFQSCYKLKTVIIPKSVTKIIDAAFQSSGLTSIVIPNSVTEIGQAAFDKTSLTTIKIPASVKVIGINPFSICEFLKEIIVDPSNKNYSSEEGVLFTKDKKTLITYPAKRELKSYTIPNTVRRIEQSAFQKCHELEAITIPNSVVEIGSWAFEGCSSLTSINIPSSVNKIDYQSFASCINLTNIAIESSKLDIWNNAIDNCYNIESIVIANPKLDIDYSMFNHLIGATLYGKAGSNIEKYAKENEFTFVIGEAPPITKKIDALKIEAESGKLRGGVRAESMEAASGGKVIAYFETLNDSVEFEKVSKGNRLTIAYSRGHKDSGKVALYINGERIQDIVFKNTGGWGNIRKVHVDVDIPEGATVKFVIESTYSAVNIDYFQVYSN